jgi:hypothetical protein
VKHAIRIGLLSLVLSSCTLSHDSSKSAFPPENIEGNSIIVDPVYQGGVWYPNNFKVWVGDHFVVNHKVPRTRPATIPTNNDNAKTPSCYIACYSRHSHHSVYGGYRFFGDNIYVMSQIGVHGRYVRRGGKSVCSPAGFETRDLSKLSFFSQLCAQKFPQACGDGKCWAGGETDWFGVGR